MLAANMASQTQSPCLSDLLQELNAVTELELLAAHLGIEQHELDKIRSDFQVNTCTHTRV